MCILVCKDRTLISIIGNRLEIRGHGWGRRKPGQPPNADVFKSCCLENPKQAKDVARLLKQMIDDE